MEEFDTKELSTIKTALAAINSYGDESSIDLDDYRVVRTNESTDDFKNSPTRHFAGLSRDIETGDGWSVDLFRDWQYKSGDTRVNLYIINLGNVRAVVEL